MVHTHYCVLQLQRCPFVRPSKSILTPSESKDICKTRQANDKFLSELFQLNQSKLIEISFLKNPDIK